MDKQDLQKKIGALKDKYVNSEESLKDIEQYESDITTLFEESKLKDHPVFIKIVEDAEKKLNELNAILLNADTLSDVERSALIKVRNVWRFIFTRFKLVPHDEAIKAMSQLLDSKLEQ